jgi:small-conductance mechanosensitive channel
MKSVLITFSFCLLIADVSISGPVSAVLMQDTLITTSIDTANTVIITDTSIVEELTEPGTVYSQTDESANDAGERNGSLLNDDDQTGYEKQEESEGVAGENGETAKFESMLFDDVQNIISFRKLFISALILFMIYFVLRFFTSLIENLSERFTSNRLVLKRIIPILKITLWSLGLYFVIAGILDPPIETIITVSASVGIAVGFASQDILRNVFGGVMIILDKPFQVGDKIDIAGHYGEVIEIGLRSVRIVTADDSVVSLPNGELMNKAVSNSNSSALNCQVVAEIFLPADVDLVEVRELAYKTAATSRYVYLNKPIVVNALNEVHYDRFIVKLRVKAYVLDIRYEFRFKSDMTELILAELSERGILASELPDKLQVNRPHT